MKFCDQEKGLKIKDLRIARSKDVIVDNAQLRIDCCSLTSLVGRSGVGKTTILRAINRLIDEDPHFVVSGTIRLDGRDIYSKDQCVYDLRRRVGMVFQKPTLFPVSVYKNVLFGIRKPFLSSKNEFDPLVEKCLKDAYLWDEVKDRLHQSALGLSIGQQQRLAIARTLAVSPSVLLLDEPTASLDHVAADKINELMVSLAKDHIVVLVTHDRRQAESISSRVIELVSSSRGCHSSVLGLQ